MRPLTHRAGSCENGPCPNVFDYEPAPGMAAVQGIQLTDPDALAQLKDMPGHESIVLVPRTLLIEYARMIAQEEQQA